MRQSKILLTGGHAVTTALATIEELIRRKANYETYWVGSRSSETSVFLRRGVSTYKIYAGKLERKFSQQAVFSFLKIPLGFGHGFYLLNKIKPDLVVSFGGYSALPIVFSAWLRRIPIIIHEQVATAGLANRLSAIFAKKICLARETSQKYFPAKKTILVGNPVLTQITEVSTKTACGQPPTILITSGSQGSVIINRTVKEALPRLLKKYQVIHLTGKLDFDKFKQIKDKNYQVYATVDPLELDNLYRQADIVVARAGANTVSEIMATKRPAILIPIPWSYLDEQNQNALLAKKFGLARIIPQAQLTSERLLTEIAKIITDYPKIIREASQRTSSDFNAAKKLVDVIVKFL